MAGRLVFAPDPIVAWICTRLETRPHKSEYIFAEELWGELLCDMGLPPNAKKVEGRNRTEVMHLIRATLGLGSQKAKRRGKHVGGCYEHLAWVEAEVVPDEEKITIILD